LFEQVFLSHLAADEDDIDLTLKLLRAAKIKAAMRGDIENLALGIFADDPRLRMVRRETRGLLYRITLCRVVWADMEPLQPLRGHMRVEVSLL